MGFNLAFKGLMRHENMPKLRKSTRIKLVWPFTANVGRENGKKSI
jgi:hypothetical protein